MCVCQYQDFSLLAVLLRHNKAVADNRLYPKGWGSKAGATGPMSAWFTSQPTDADPEQNDIPCLDLIHVWCIEVTSTVSWVVSARVGAILSRTR